jgi:hypothetical protein
LHRVERVAELRRGVALALGDVAPALLGDPALLHGERGERVGPGPRERSLELGRAELGLFRDDLVEPRPAALDLGVERRRLRPRPAQRDDRGRCGGHRDDRGDGSDDRGYGDSGHRL